MGVFSNFSDRIHYYLDNIRANKLNVKIEHFKFDLGTNSMIVIYRLGRQKLLNKMEIFQFEREYFEKVSAYDQHRLTKTSMFQHMLIDLFSSASCSRGSFINYIQDETKNEQLF